MQAGEKFARSSSNRVSRAQTALIQAGEEVVAVAPAFLLERVDQLTRRVAVAVELALRRRRCAIRDVEVAAPARAAPQATSSSAASSSRLSPSRVRVARINALDRRVATRYWCRSSG